MGEFEELDYALRENGWLQEFEYKRGVRCFVADKLGKPVALTILAPTGEVEAEFRMALRADKIGSGLGMAVASQTLASGFGDLGLVRIHLVVRKDKQRAIRLYERLGFSRQGECSKSFNGKTARFLVMDLRKNDGSNKSQEVHEGLSHAWRSESIGR